MLRLFDMLICWHGLAISRGELERESILDFDTACCGGWWLTQPEISGQVWVLPGSWVRFRLAGDVKLVWKWMMDWVCKCIQINVFFFFLKFKIGQLCFFY